MKKYPLLSKIDSPLDVKKLSSNSLVSLSNEITQYIQDVIEQIGGH